MPTDHQTAMLRSSGPFAQTLVQHGEAVVIAGTSYTVTFSERETTDLDGQTWKAATMRGLDSALPALPTGTKVSRSGDSSTWGCTGPGRAKSGVRIVSLQTWTQGRVGGLG